MPVAVACAALAADPAALVEDVTGASAGVQFMDYVAPGRAIKLAKGDTLVLSYLKSCRRESITGGVVTVGAEQSMVVDGKVEIEKVDCDPGKLNLTTAQAAKSGTMVFRSVPGKAAALPAAEITLYGLSPVLELAGAGKVSFEFEPRGEASKRAAPDPGKAIGAHPADGKVITLKSGRYGPYVQHGKLNATLPRDLNPEELTLEQAVELLAIKAAAK